MSASDALAGPEETLSPTTAVPAGKITVDGDLAEWDFTGSQTCYVSGEFLEKENAEFVFSYDKEALYLAAKVQDSTPLRNAHHPAERFWEGDCVTLRLYTKLKDNQRVPNRTHKDPDSPSRVVNLSFFQQHTTGATWKFASYGADMGETKFNPEGIECAFREFPDKTGYAFEAKIPWPALNVPLSPQPGESMRALVQFDFGNAAGDRRIRQSPAAYLVNPGDFGFLNTDAWGYLQFAAEALKKRAWPSPSELAASVRKAPEGQPIPLKLPQAGRVTVNISDPKTGEIVRELVVDQNLAEGEASVLWDGKTNAGEDAPLGEYKWKALVHQPIEAHYLGSVGSSGTPPCQNDAGTGEWGGD
ncbi:MAG: FlgD immunoglobulin-like domain containing protein, partial [Terrimicrobiaceae bacterium]